MGFGYIKGFGSVNEALSAHTSDTTDAHDATAISFAPAGTIAATNVQAAIEEVATEAGGGGYELIAESTLGAPAATIDFSSIPATYKHLRLLYSARGTNASNTVNLSVRFNNDSTAVYDYIAYRMWDSGLGGSSISGATSLKVAEMSGANATAGMAGQGTVDIPAYATAGFYRTLTSQMWGAWSTAANGFQLFTTGGQWRSTTAINQITLVLSAGNFDTGSTVSLYGISGA